MLVADPLSLVGSTLAHKYVVDSIVRVESLAVVYRATQRLSNRAVAVRVFTSLAKVPGERRKALYHDLVRDEQKLAELAPLVPAVYPARDVGTLVLAGGSSKGEWVPFVVLDWPHGVTLRQLMVDAAHLEGAPRTMPEVVTLLEPVAVALAIAHEHGVVHAGVTPDHVLFTEEDARGRRKARLLDFGVAKLLRGRVHESTIDARTDVAAFAQMMLDLYSASNGASDRGATASSMGAARGLGLGDAVEAVFARALAPRAEDRFGTVGDLWGELRRALDLPKLQSVTITQPPEEPRSSSAGSLAPTTLGKLTKLGLGLGTGSVGAILPEAPRSRALMGLAGLAMAAATVLAYVQARPDDEHAQAAPPPPAPTQAPAPMCPNGMIDVPAATFTMGDDAGLDVERPAHRVTTSRFCIDKFEVTTEDYKKCSDRGECVRAARMNAWSGITERDRAAYDPLCNARDPEARAKHPINCVSWENAAAYCAQAGKRLPTEAEWELAARGTDGRHYPWGDAVPTASLLNACGKECRAWARKNRVDDVGMYDADDAWMHTAPIGSFPAGASPYGMQDAAGNVWEWVDDWYAPYTKDESIDPPGPGNGDRRVMRGGAWNGAHEAWVRATFRFGGDPQMKSHGIGFRCALGF